MSISKLKASYPEYFISKNKIQLKKDTDIEFILASLKQIYSKEEITTIDGLKIDFKDGWIHLRKSNTEPIIRIYAESSSQDKANLFAKKMINEIKDLV